MFKYQERALRLKYWELMLIADCLYKEAADRENQKMGDMTVADACRLQEKARAIYKLRDYLLQEVIIKED